MTPPLLRLYLGFGATWQTADVDIVWTHIDIADDSDGLNPSDGVTLKRGRESMKDDFATGEFSATLVNLERTFDPLHPDSAYYGSLEPGTPAKVTAQPDGEAETIVWRGTVSGFPQHWDGPWATVPLNGYGLFDKLARAKLPESMYDTEVLADGPVAYWKLDDTSESLMLDSSGNDRDGVYDNPLLQQEPLLADGGHSAVFEHVGDQRGRYHGSLITAFPFTIEAWVKFPRELTQAHTFVTAFNNSSLSSRIYFICFEDGSPPNPGGAVGLLVRVGASREAQGTITVDDDLPHHVVGVFTTATSWELYVDGVADTLAYPTAGVPSDPVGVDYWAVGNFIDSGFGDFGIGGGIDNVAVYDVALTPTQVLAHYNAGTAPRDGDRSDERIAWVAGLIGLPADRLNLEAGQSFLGPTPLGGNALEYLRRVEASEYGRFFEAADGRLRFLDRYWDYTATVASTPQAVFTDQRDGSGIFYTASDLVKDDELLINALTLSRKGGPDITVRDDPSVAAYGEAGDTQGDLLLRSDAEVRSLAEHVVSLRSTPQTRVPSLAMPLHVLDPADQAAVLSLEIGYRITVKRTPQGVGDEISLDFIIEGVDDDVTPGEWFRSLYVSPAPAQAVPDTAWIWDTSTWDTDTRWGPVTAPGSESQLFVWDTSTWDETSRWAF